MDNENMQIYLKYKMKYLRLKKQNNIVNVNQEGQACYTKRWTTTHEDILW